VLDERNQDVERTIAQGERHPIAFQLAFRGRESKGSET
jgi:hypothetical protein